MTEEIKHLAFKGIEKKDQIVLKSFLNLAKNELKYKVVVLKGRDNSEQNPDVLIVADGYKFNDDEKAFESLPSIILGDNLDEEWSGYITNPIQWSDFRIALTQFSEPTFRGDVKETVIEEQAEDQLAIVEEVDDEDEISEDTILELTSEDLADEQEVIGASGEDGEEIDEFADEELLTVEDMDVENVSEDETMSAIPDEAKFAIEEIEEDSITNDESSDFEPIDPEFELDNMSIDYASHTNSEYLKVVDDVQQFQESEGAPSAMLLVTDEESNSSNSVLVIETNSLDAWEFSERDSTAADEMDSSEIAKQAVASMANGEFDDNAEEVELPNIKPKSGFDIAPDEKYWEADNEIIADNISVLCVKHQRKMVYSNQEPGKWLGQMQGKKLSKLPLNDDWRPKKSLTAYPVSQLIWVDTLMTKNDKLLEGLSDDVEYILEKWPNFDLLQLDNVLLKLCSLLFVKPESLNSLVEKSGYSRTTVRGLMNACYKEGLLKNTDEVKVGDLIAAGDDGVFGKIKGVFR